MDLEGIETQDVCAALERHSNRYGVPSFVYVDNGTQLKALQYAKFSVRDLDAMVQDNLGMKIIVSNAKAHSERGRVERRIRVLRETMEKMETTPAAPRRSFPPPICSSRSLFRCFCVSAALPPENVGG